MLWASKELNELEILKLKHFKTPNRELRNMKSYQTRK